MPLLLPGNFCVEGTGKDIQPCPAGFYCPQGTGHGFLNACPLGTYSPVRGLSAAAECLVCEAGFYCPDGSSQRHSVAPIPCPAGTFNPRNGSGHAFNCQPCPAGMACPNISLTAPAVHCAEGYFCPNGTVTPNQFPCPPGTFTGATNLMTAEECTICPAGKACRWGTGVNVSVALDCKPGHYCPLGTPYPDRFPCPPGTFSNRSNLTAAPECNICPERFYCVGGEAAPTAVCPPGHYCPSQTRFADEFPCPPGTYNSNVSMADVTGCQNCTQGHFCERGAVRPLPCAAGTYMPHGVYSPGHTLAGVLTGQPAANKSDCLPCTAGHSCSLATVEPRPCGAARFSSAGRSACDDCRAGHYCDSNRTTEAAMLKTKRCPSGDLCKAGLATLNESLPCPTGFYCPEGGPCEND